MSEKDIIEQLRLRADGALDMFLTRFTPLVMYVITPILENAEDREECLSEIAMRVWDGIDTYAPEKGNFSTWLTALCRNTAINRAKADAVHLPLDESIRSDAPTPEQTALLNERREQISRAILSLSDSDRALIYRKYYYLQSTEQIAAELNMSVRAAEGRLYRAKKRLRKLLGGDGLE